MEPDEPYTEFRPGRSDHGTSSEHNYVAPTDTMDAYTVGDVIGKGGMGEVLSAQDRRMGRTVAIKRLTAVAPTDADISRFFREARIQARLDHPAVVPVHELGRDSQGRPYFTMKQCTGVTLRDQLPSEQPASRRLLRAFAEVCLAVEFAHARGIVHRDLKPSNIMLGDYGEVYILDWGLARVIDDVAPVENKDIDSLDEDKQPSALLGTPGYIAPEQLHTNAEVGRPVDVYALGSILFEILTKMPLHPRQSQAAIQSTLSTTGVLSPIARYPEIAIPPELDTLCTEALAMQAKTRPTAHEMGERVQAYLDGDRDLARRKAVADEALAKAREALDGDQRADAMRDAGRALALDPDCAGAAEIVTRLMLEPPKDPPPELQQELREADAHGVKRHALTAIISYGAIAAFLPIAMWNGIRKWPDVLAVFVMALLLALGAALIRKKPLRSLGAMIVYALGNGFLCVMMSRMAGPFTFVPALICVVTMSVMAYPQFLERPVILVGIMVASFALPLALEAQGLLRTTWELADSRLISHAEALVIGGPKTMTLVIGATIGTFVVAGFHAASIGRTNRRAQLQLVTQAWHLRQLLPKGPT
jgi:hypothetical protein